MFYMLADVHVLYIGYGHVLYVGLCSCFICRPMYMFLYIGLCTCFICRPMYMFYM